MNERSFSNGVRVATVLSSVGNKVAKVAVTAGTRVATATRSTGNITNSFYQGLKTGFCAQKRLK